MKYISKIAFLGLAGLLSLSGCVEQPEEYLTEIDPAVFEPKPFDIDNYSDTYGGIASWQFSFQWGPYNLHDPSIVKGDDGWYYCYSTDVAYGQSIRPGIMVRKSQDLVDWKFVGQAIDGLPQQAVDYIEGKGATANEGIWAPYIMKVGGEYRLYYSLASDGFRVSAIGLLTASSPEGPWVEKGLAVVSETDGPGTNAIDPTVVVTPAGDHYMYYGSAWDGLFVVQLDPATGLAATAGDKGKLIVRRGQTDGMYNGNLEGPEIIYNKEHDKYYLFVAYDWLATKYNVRVFRADSPEGPFLDWDGVPADEPHDNNAPMILAPYAFEGHAGWQGTAHCSVFEGVDGEYFMANQGRPVVDPAAMVMHVRKVMWTEEGWPMVSPERYANVPNDPVTKEELVGSYDQLLNLYTTVPGYGNEQTDPGINGSFISNLLADGTINGDPNNTWEYNAPWLELKWANGAFIDKMHVSRERDWERKISSTVVMTGFNGGGLSIWFKKRPVE
ncbi:arabinan endo-1,5-alpha-L-arabinosidase [Limibacter armeniacum]|uniref:arabinan endo-1,5-alpha-L-arabinosidase n=1 Tax=Limibacter armeniacum TaxID=466084 RepID=UPI002FE5FB53